MDFFIMLSLFPFSHHTFSHTLFFTFFSHCPALTLCSTTSFPASLLPFMLLCYTLLLILLSSL
ncbi:hypothetical protein Lalb_Chr08g0230991 [Lupinus albus]|uniref:Uncharacterized protein n=1 Tax=Lupinus albus TaxID=3870 RepID=A0A6A4Q327_LUPAL|nr:hypothetical protein Lalb_Chr08g0230991 [Lupinus albus]